MARTQEHVVVSSFFLQRFFVGQQIMKAFILCYFIVALVIVSSQEEGDLCGSETCSPAQVCEEGKCECTKIRCFIFCPFGFKRDKNGCEYPCTCANEDEGVSPCGREECSGAQVCVDERCECPAERCKIGCPFGFKKDKNGCEYPCTCAEEPQQEH